MDKLAEFLRGLESIPWLKNIGQPSPHDRDVLRIYSWDRWAGPEEPGSEIQASFHVRWQEELLLDVFNEKLSPLFEEIQEKVRALARRNVPYDDKKDAWHGPTTSVWTAGWIAAVIGCTIARGRELGEYNPKYQWSAANEWHWYKLGHWPCSYFWSWGEADQETVARLRSPQWLIVF